MKLLLLIITMLFTTHACFGNDLIDLKKPHHAHRKKRKLVKHSKNFVKRSRNFIIKGPKNNHHKIPIKQSTTITRAGDNQIIGAPVGPAGVTTLTMESDLHVSSVVEFMGNTAINGNGNVLYLDAGGSLQVDANSTLNIKNLTIKGIAGSNIYCVDNTGNIMLQNVNWVQDSDFTFSHGSLDFLNNVRCVGNGLNFIYSTTQGCTVHAGAVVTFDYRFTFKYVPTNELNNLFTLADSASTLYFDGGSLYAGPGGLLLKKGLLFFEGETSFDTASGITLGDGTEINDTICIFGSAAILNHLNGSLIYNNVLESSWNMRDINAILKIFPATTFNLLESLNLGAGQLLLSTSASFLTAPDAAITGNVSFF